MGAKKCYRNDGSRGDVTYCHNECVGGCSGAGVLASPEDCYACKNVYYESSNGSGTCVNPCPWPFLTVRMIIF
jgi:hypothetical protein